jgi:hypothetical protein
MSFAVGLGVHVLMLAVLVALFYRRMMPFTFFRFAR